MADLRGRFAERDRLRTEMVGLNVAAQNRPRSRLQKAQDDLWTLLDTPGASTTAAVRELESALIEAGDIGGMALWGATGQLAQAGRPDVARYFLDKFAQRDSMRPSSRLFPKLRRMSPRGPMPSLFGLEA